MVRAGATLARPRLAAVLIAGTTLLGCTSTASTPAAPTSASRPATASPHLQSTVSPPPKAVAFNGCQRIDGADLTAVPGVSWKAGSAVSKRLGCHVTLRTAVAGGTLEVDFQPSGTARSDVRTRLTELASAHRQHSAVTLDDVKVGSLAGGVAYTQQSAASYVLYASTPTTVINVVCNLPATVVGQSIRVPALNATAEALLGWALAHQPSQGPT